MTRLWTLRAYIYSHSANTRQTPLLKRIDFLQIRPTDSNFSKKLQRRGLREWNEIRLDGPRVKKTLKKFQLVGDGEEVNGNLNNILCMIYVSRTIRRYGIWWKSVDAEIDKRQASKSGIEIANINKPGP